MFVTPLSKTKQCSHTIVIQLQILSSSFITHVYEPCQTVSPQHSYTSYQEVISLMYMNPAIQYPLHHSHTSYQAVISLMYVNPVKQSFHSFLCILPNNHLTHFFASFQTFILPLSTCLDTLPNNLINFSAIQ